jgi:hypothetical protein
MAGDFTQRVKRDLETWGWYVIINAAQRDPVPLVALKLLTYGHAGKLTKERPTRIVRVSKQIMFVRCVPKAGLGREAWNKLFETARSVRVKPVLAYRGQRGAIDYRLICHVYPNTEEEERWIGEYIAGARSSTGDSFVEMTTRELRAEAKKNLRVLLTRRFDIHAG